MTIGGYSQRVGGADDLAAGLDDLLTLPDHAHDGAGAHVVDEVAEEGLGGEIGVVLLGVRLLGLHHLHAAEEETLLLEALDDGADEAALDAVGLDHDVGLLGGHFCRVCRVWLGVSGGITRADRKNHEKQSRRKKLILE